MAVNKSPLRGGKHREDVSEVPASARCLLHRQNIYGSIFGVKCGSCRPLEGHWNVRRIYGCFTAHLCRQARRQDSAPLYPVQRYPQREGGSSWLRSSPPNIAHLCQRDSICPCACRTYVTLRPGRGGKPCRREEQLEESRITILFLLLLSGLIISWFYIRDSALIKTGKVPSRLLL